MRFQKMLDKAGVAMQTSRDGWQLFKEKNTQCNKGVSMELALVQAIMSEPENRSFDIKDGRLVTQKDKDHALQIGARLHQELTARIQGCSLPQYHIDIFGKQLTAGRPDCWILDDPIEPLDTERLKTDASYWDEHPGVPEDATMYFPEDDTWEATWGMMEAHVYQFNNWNDDEQAWESGLDLWLDDDFMRRGILKPGQTYETMLGPKTRIEAAGRSNTGTNKDTPSPSEQPEGVSGIPYAVTYGVARGADVGTAYVERKAMEAKDLATEQYLLECIEAEKKVFHQRTAEYQRQLDHIRAMRGAK